MSETTAAGIRPYWVSADLFPFQSRFVQLDDCRVHYVDEGEGAVLVLLHGNPTWCFLYRRVIERLRNRFRCVALDYPGFGLSSAAPGYGFTPAEHAVVVERFVEALGLDSFTLVLHDWGGPIGLAVASRQPGRVRGLVITNTFAWLVDGDRHFEWFSRIMGGGLGRVAIRRLNAFVNVMVPLGTGRRMSKPEMTHYRGPFPNAETRMPTHVFPREILGSRTFLSAVEAGLPRLTHLPTLIAWGGGDFAFRESERRRFESTFPHHRSVVFDRAGHYLHEDVPEELAAEIGRWWDEHGH